jgi:catalase
MTDSQERDGRLRDGFGKDKQLYQFQDRPDGEYLTTNLGVRVTHTDDSLKAGERGPTLLQDFHFREKITHFDHERIPERVVHARGSAAHGYFRVFESMADYTTASFLQDPSRTTPVFVRFSQVVGSRGSADTVRDVRGFATKFYTDEGVFDLVGNNIPVFFVQDAIKFLDMVHAAKPEPHHEMPQASTAHDNFWDFVSLMPESAHMIMWLLSDRGISRSYRMMEGFGVHTFRLVNGQGVSRFVKFHWKPLLGVHGLVWDEAQKLAGKDPDWLRRDLWEAIQQGDYPEWNLGVQIMEESDAERYPFDVLDPTKIWPEELIPVQRIGRMVLNRNPENFFAETEQVAFHIGNLVPGIDVTNDPLLQGRLFSYLDTQLNRFNSTNFHEIPINKSVAPVHNNQQDGFMRQTINHGRVNYFPNSLGNNSPMPAPVDAHGYTSYPEAVSGPKVRGRGEKFRDYFSQATLFWNSLSVAEQQHLVDAARFELGRCESPLVRQRMVAIFDQIDRELARQVAEQIGVQPPTGEPIQMVDASGAPIQRRAFPGRTVDRSPALSMDNTVKDTVLSRRVACLVAPGVDGNQVMAVKGALEAAGAHVDIIASNLGAVAAANGDLVPVDKSAITATSVTYDAVFVPGGAAAASTLRTRGEVLEFINEAFKHGKAIAACGEGSDVLRASSLPLDGRNLATQGVIVTDGHGDLDGFSRSFVSAIAQHRFPLRSHLQQVPV